jgi:hypothetical protein
VDHLFEAYLPAPRVIRRATISHATPCPEHPLRTETGRRIRGAFRAEGAQLIEADYAELEVRIAVMSEPVAKIVGKAEMACNNCEHAHYSVCRHPKFQNKNRVKPLIIAEQGSVAPPFCPLPEEEQRRRHGNAQ